MIRALSRRKRLWLPLTMAAAGMVLIATSPANASPGPQRPVRSGERLPFGMSKLTHQRMIAQVPLDNAATRIRLQAAATPAGKAGLVQVVVDDTRRSLTVYWHGSMPGGMRNILRSLRRHVDLSVRPARYSLAQLVRAANAAARSGSSVASAAPLNDGSGIQVAVTGPVRAMSPAVRTHLGIAVPVQVVAGQRSQFMSCDANPSDNAGPGSRCDDLAPGFWGGAVIDLFSGGVVTSFCSTGFGAHGPGGTVMLTAGHCVQGTVSPTTTWWNGQGTTELGSLENSNLIDSQTIASHDDGDIITPGVSGDQIYTGPSIFNGDTHSTATVINQQPSNPGDWLCVSGAFGGPHCNIQVVKTNISVTFNDFGNLFLTDGLVQADGGQVGNGPISGDSGSAVYDIPGNGVVTAKGTESGGPCAKFNSVGACIESTGLFYYTPMDVISADLGVTVNTP